MRKNRIALYLFIACFCICSTPSVAQVVVLYDVIVRPPGVNYRVLSDGHNEVIYQEGRKNQAAEALWTIRQTIEGTNALLGSPSNFGLTVILNNYSDAGNGYVTPFPFKSEIESVSLRGRGLSLKHPSWTQLVVTHELVHAAQANFKGHTSLLSVFGRFAPDFARAINMFVPSGLTEGMAVHRESEITPFAGRANHPYFTMQIRAAMNKSNGLTLSQLLDEPGYTRPFDRFYQGGTLFTDFYLEQYGPKALEAIFKWQQNVPILGFGANLIYATGEMPRQIRRRFQQWYDEKENELTAQIGPLTQAEQTFSEKGLVRRKPQWKDEANLFTFSLGYNWTRGFERHVFTQEKVKHVRSSTNEITDDAVFYAVPGSEEILYSRFSEHPTSGTSKTSYSYRLNSESGQETLISGSKHTYNPVQLPSGAVWALKSDGQYNSIVEGGKGLEARPILSFPKGEFVSLAPRPKSDSLAVILNIGGHQAVFWGDTSEEPFQLRPWIGFENVSIFDGSFSGDGRFFTFTSDQTGILNVFVLETSTESLWQATNVLYGAMEPQISPDGKTLAFVEYQDQRFDLKLTPVELDTWKPMARDEGNYTWTTAWEVALASEAPFVGYTPEEDVELIDKNYRSWSRLAPRMAYPTVYLDTARDNASDARLGFGMGLAMQGSDPLQRWTYHTEGILQKGRLWGEIGMQSGAFAFRPSFTLGRRPQTIQAIIGSGSTAVQQRVIRDRTSIEAGVFLPYTFNQNVKRTSLITSLRVGYRSDVYVDDQFNTIQSRFNKLTFLPAAFFGYRLVRNPRDILPSSGYSISGYGEFDLSSDAAQKNAGWIVMANAYVPLLRRFNTGIRLNTGLLVQNSASIFGLDSFKPTGWENAFLNDDAFLRYGVKVVQPVLFPDNGFILVPAFLKTVYLYGFAEHLHRASDTRDNVSSVGGGLGAKFKLFHHFDFDINYGVAYQLKEQNWVSHTTIGQE
jgi:hypothetical protein